MREEILAVLAAGPKNTEEIRVALAQDRNSLYHFLRTMRAEKILQSKKPKVNSDPMVWRINPTYQSVARRNSSPS